MTSLEHPAIAAEKPKAPAKTIVIMEIKPWGILGLKTDILLNQWLNYFPTDDETDMDGLETAIRAIKKDGLTWGGAKLKPIGFGISKLEMSLVVEDERISVADLEHEIQGLEDFVQSTDITAMQKL